jgi:hypothetical protein
MAVSLIIAELSHIDLSGMVYVKEPTARLGVNMDFTDLCPGRAPVEDPDGKMRVLRVGDEMALLLESEIPMRMQAARVSRGQVQASRSVRFGQFRFGDNYGFGRTLQ